MWQLEKQKLKEKKIQLYQKRQDRSPLKCKDTLIVSYNNSYLDVGGQFYDRETTD